MDARFKVRKAAPEHALDLLDRCGLGGARKKWRRRLVKESAENYQCSISWHKDKHSERNKIIPYRVSVRGEQAPACAQWLVEEMLMAGLDMEDIWSLPVPEQKQQEEVPEVQLTVDGIITRVAPETSQRIDTTALASVQREETIKLI